MKLSCAQNMCRKKLQYAGARCALVMDKYRYLMYSANFRLYTYSDIYYIYIYF